jgi:predicted RNase H-like nuclease (RuvC/YqgF family)
MLSLDEAIKHCEEVAEEQEKKARKKNDGTMSTRIKCEECAKEHRQLAEWLRELKKYKIKFEYIISQLEERARQLEYILEQNSWCDGDEEYRLDEINAVVEFIKKTYELKSVLDIREVNADVNT